MAALTNSDAAAALQLLTDAQDDRLAELASYKISELKEDADEEVDSPSPILDCFYNTGGTQTIIQMTSFTPVQFYRVWSILQDHVNENWNTGRVRNSSHSGKDVLFMLFTVMKHSGQWDFLARIFKIKGPTFERLNTGFLDCIWEEVYFRFVLQWGDKYSMSRVVQEKKTFKHFPHARYATDVTFQQMNRPCGNLQEAKSYFSGKHKLYGYKVEVSVLSNGLAIFATDHFAGSVSDIDIFFKHTTQHKELLSKKGDEGDILDAGQHDEEFSGSWSVLADKGYQAALDFARVTHPKKNPPRGLLCREDMKENEKKCSDRIILENYFGRHCMLWTVMSVKHRWKESIYDKLFKFCLGMTNWHVKYSPLRADDTNHFTRHKNRLHSIGSEIVEKRRRSQQKYRLKRRRRLNSKFRATSDDETVAADDAGVAKKF